jgi:hypothetical protein
MEDRVLKTRMNCKWLVCLSVVGLLGAACQKNLELNSRTFTCTSSADCLDGRVCAPAPDGTTRICQAPSDDAGQDTRTDVEDDTSQPDTDTCTPQVFFVDDDGDGYGVAVEQCDKPPNTVDEGGDCDDANPDVFPGAGEVCNGRDSDCDGTVDQIDAAGAESCFSTVGDVRTVGDSGSEVIDQVLFVNTTAAETASPVVIAGRYDSGTSLTLGGTPLALPRQGAFVTRLGADGRRRWVVTFSTASAATAPHIDLDSQGNVYVGMNFPQDIEIAADGPATPETFDSSDGKTDAVVARITAAGEVTHTNHLRGAEQQTIDALSVGLDDQPYIGGSFSRELTTQTLDETSGTDIRTGYIARLTTELTVVNNGTPEVAFLRNADGSNADNIFVDAMTVVEDDNQPGTNEVYFAGRFQDRLQLGSDVFFDGSGEQAYAGKLHFNGDGSVEREWISVLETTQTARVTDLAAITGGEGDSDDVMILSGWFSGELTLPGEADGTGWTANATDGFVAALGSGGAEGTLAWKQLVTGANDQRVRAVSVPFYNIEGQGEFFPIYATCDVTGPTTIDDGSTTATSGQPDDQDALLLWFGNDDSGLSAPRIGGIDHYTSSGDLSLSSLATQSVIETAVVQPPRRIITSGSFGGEAQIALDGQLEPTRISAEGTDGIVIDTQFPGMTPEAASF